MKSNLRSKIRDFLASEEGKVGLKGPLTLGVATSSLLLAQVIIGIPHAEAVPCIDHDDCYMTDFCAHDGVCRPI